MVELIKHKGIHHVSLNVTDLKSAKYFYETILGLTEIERPDFDFPGAWYEINNQQLHLIVLPSSQTIRSDKRLSSREGHFALRVESYDLTLDWLKKNGIDVQENYNSVSGFAQIFCTDPDGNLIELNIDRSEYSN
jgi:glyoxylase I family protein